MPTLDEIKKSKNIVDLLEKDEVLAIGAKVVTGFEIDEESRVKWKEIVDQAMDIMAQTMETKNYPWPHASNLKFPIITKAAINYASRTMPEIIQNDKVVKCGTIGDDPTNEKFERANRVSEFMSWQFVSGMDCWEQELDSLLNILAVTGVAFKKTYYDTLRNKPTSELCLPHRIVINHSAKTLESANRITHIIELSQNEVVERQRKGIFDNEVEIEGLRPSMSNNEDCEVTDSRDEDFPIYLLEQHCFLDLDEDGYKEPYVVTVHRESKRVLRIVGRFGEVNRNKEGEVVNIEPIQYFTDFHFLPNPDGGYYSQGFGTLMLSLNSSVNTIWNQLVNSGTLATTSTGIATRGFRVKNGEFKIKMGEINILDLPSNVDISKAMYMLPFKEPSDVLFKLLEMLIKVCDDLTGSTDVNQGKQPAQNVASGTISQLIEQGAKVYTAINKRVYRSLKKEYEKVYKINSKYLSNKEYREVLNDPKADVKKDFELTTLNVYPIADPTMSNINQRLSKAMAISQLKTVDPRAADEYILNSLQIDKSQINILLPKPDPKAPPSLPDQKLMSEISLNNANAAKLSGDSQLQAQSNQLAAAKLQQEGKWSEQQIQESATRNWKMQKDAVHNDMKLGIVKAKMQSEQALKVAHLQISAQKEQDSANNASEGTKNQRIKVVTDAELGAAKLASEAVQHKKDVNHDAAKTIIASVSKMGNGSGGGGGGGGGSSGNSTSTPNDSQMLDNMNNNSAPTTAGQQQTDAAPQQMDAAPPQTDTTPQQTEAAPPQTDTTPQQTDAAPTTANTDTGQPAQSQITDDSSSTTDNNSQEVGDGGMNE